ncbi:ArsR/SmtB family transcription factor [Aquimarina algiphila]|uniref:ArsR/SmtB family transcription factor n=1 Tax=Aquimarina algiphila TaxID=2047982 RepID=UPI00232EA2A0|nr:ArsR family transcriptional regulator [Aquimarina algiphila]
MKILEINKVLSNQVRINILHWLKTPELHFPKQLNVPDFRDGVCVCHIQEKAGLSQSTVSHYLSMMNKVNLIILTRHGKWTYYKRNEESIKDYIEYLRKEL